MTDTAGAALTADDIASAIDWASQTRHGQDRAPHDDECVCGYPWPCALAALTALEARLVAVTEERDALRARLTALSHPVGMMTTPRELRTWANHLVQRGWYTDGSEIVCYLRAAASVQTEEGQ